MNQPSGRRWLIGAVGLFLVLLVVWIAAAVRISASAAAPSSLMSSLRSRLSANYSPDGAGSSVRSLRLSIFQEVMQDLGLSSDEAAAQSQEMQAEMQAPVPTATARDFQGALPLTATSTVTPIPTETPAPTATSTSTRPPKPTPTKTKTPKPTGAAPVPTNTPSGGDTDPPVVTAWTSSVTVAACSADIDIDATIYDAPMSSGIAQVQIKYKVPSYVGSYTYLDDISYCSGGIKPDGSWQGCYDGTVTFDKILSGWGPPVNPGPTDFQVEIYVKPIDGVGQHGYYLVDTFSLSHTCDD
jgi:hypothetical protein